MPAAPSFRPRPLAGTAWRLVEAQHRVSTLKLVDTVEEQTLLERLIDDSKPVIPLECRHLEYLLATPFRYGAPYPRGSRFRRAGLSEGVFYAAEAVRTAVAETVFARLLFFAESPATPWPRNAAEHTAFSVSYRSDKAIDLTAGMLARQRAAWTHPTDYAPCQNLAGQARDAGIDLIRYESARDPGRGANLALLRCRVFARPKPVERQSWWIRLSASGAQMVREFPRLGIDFDRQTFAADPRIARLNWERG
ncbi:MAG: hypothetical protein K0S54_1104 [Alphaproteobacteria bacterium]|jgi:hypothetical protein|nr:hypothetical protein [Alphaproteobacteria bacterium]